MVSVRWTVYAFQIARVGWDAIVKIGCTRTSDPNVRIADLRSPSGSDDNDEYGRVLAETTHLSEPKQDLYGNDSSSLEQDVLAILREAGASDPEYWDGRSGKSEVFRLTETAIQEVLDYLDARLATDEAESFLREMIGQLDYDQDRDSTHGGHHDFAQDDNLSDTTPKEEREDYD